MVTDLQQGGQGPTRLPARLARLEGGLSFAARSVTAPAWDVSRGSEWPRPAPLRPCCSCVAAPPGGCSVPGLTTRENRAFVQLQSAPLNRSEPQFASRCCGAGFGGSLLPGAGAAVLAGRCGPPGAVPAAPGALPAAEPG